MMRRLCVLLAANLVVIASAGADTPPLPERVEVNAVAFELIPAGWFTYTLPSNEVFTPLPPDMPAYRHLRIWLDDYYLATFEATAQDLARFLNDSATPAALKEAHAQLWTRGGEAEKRTGVGCTLTRDAQGRFIPLEDERQLPATYLTWEHATAFARWMGFRLPSDAEWQKGARGTDERIWPWGNRYPDDTYALFSHGRHCTPAEVDAFPKGRSPYGLYNMAGNVSEHVADWYLFPY